jgi:hypothetical protein
MAPPVAGARRSPAGSRPSQAAACPGGSGRSVRARPGMSREAGYGYDLTGSGIGKTQNGQASTTCARNASNLPGGITTPTGSAGYLYNGEGERIDGA